MQQPIFNATCQEHLSHYAPSIRHEPQFVQQFRMYTVAMRLEVNAKVLCQLRQGCKLISLDEDLWGPRYKKCLLFSRQQGLRFLFPLVQPSETFLIHSGKKKEITIHKKYPRNNE